MGCEIMFFKKISLSAKIVWKPCSRFLCFLLQKTVSSGQPPEPWQILTLASLALWKETLSSFYSLSLLWHGFHSSSASPGYSSLPLAAYPVKALLMILISALYSPCLCWPFPTHLFTQLIHLLSANHGGHCIQCKGHRTQRTEVLWRPLSSDGVRGLNKETCDEDFERDKQGAEMKSNTGDRNT